jgi:hypothetical protein
MRCIALLIAVTTTLGVSAVSRAQDDDPNSSRADVNGKVHALHGAMSFPGVPTADHARMNAQVERLWSIFVQNPALNPPIGFDIEPSFVANGLLPGPREPYIGRAGGYIHWYIYVAAHRRVERIEVADHAVILVTNHPSMVLSQKWQEDAQGIMYYEPRAIRRVGGYPQYENGVIAVTDSPRPLFRPVPLERVLRSELAISRSNLEAVGSAAAVAASYDPAANLEAWLRDRSKRQRDSERMIQDVKKSNPKLAEQLQKNFETAEQATEKVLRDLAANPKRTAQPPAVQARDRAQHAEAQRCIATLEKELAGLSPPERTSPAYVALAGGRTPSPKGRCSMTVDPTFPNALRIVERNPDFFDTTLPRTEAQVVLVDFSSLHENAPRGTNRWQRTYDRLREGMNYEALAATIGKR